MIIFLRGKVEKKTFFHLFFDLVAFSFLCVIPVAVGTFHWSFNPVETFQVSGKIHSGSPILHLDQKLPFAVVRIRKNRKTLFGAVRTGWTRILKTISNVLLIFITLPSLMTLWWKCQQQFKEMAALLLLVLEFVHIARGCLSEVQRLRRTEKYLWNWCWRR